MKHLKSINEYGRTVGFRYSEPKESYNITCILAGEDITKEKIDKCLSKVSELYYEKESVKVDNQDGEVQIGDVIAQINAIVLFDIKVYNEKEILTILEELGEKLDMYDIQLIDFKSKKNFLD